MRIAVGRGLVPRLPRRTSNSRVSTAFPGGISVASAVLLLATLLLLALLPTPVLAQAFSVSGGMAFLQLKPGEKVTGSISVTNTGEKPATLRLYLGDRAQTEESRKKYDYAWVEPGSGPRSLADWMTVSPMIFTLQPGETSQVFYEVALPEDAALAGSYLGVFFIEHAPPEEAPGAVLEGDAKTPRVAIRTIFRYAIQVHATIPGTEERKAKFTAIDIQQAQGGFDVLAVFENEGNVYTRPECWIELIDANGEKVYTAEHSKITVLPETVRQYKFEIRSIGIPAGQYRIMVIADYGAMQMIAAQANINLAQALPPPPPPPEEEVAVEEDAAAGTETDTETDTETPSEDGGGEGDEPSPPEPGGAAEE